MFATSFPEHAGVGARADQVRRRAVRAERVRSRHRSVEAGPRAQAAGRSRATSAPRPRCWRTRSSIASATSKPRRPTCARSRYSPRTIRIAPAIEERIAASIYKQAEAKQTAGDATGAVDDFLRVGALAPNSKVRANAEFDAAGILMRNKEWERAAQVLEGFRRNYPKHELAPDVTRKLAVAYLETGRWHAGRRRVRAHRCARRGNRGGAARGAVAGRGAVRERSASPTKPRGCMRAT